MNINYLKGLILVSNHPPCWSGKLLHNRNHGPTIIIRWEFHRCPSNEATIRKESRWEIPIRNSYYDSNIFFKVFQANVFGGNMFQCRYIFMYVGTHSLPAASTKMALMHCASFKMFKLRHSSILLWQTPTRTNSRQHLSRLKIAAWSCQWLRFNLSLYSSIKGNRGHEIWKVFSNS